MVEAVTRPRLVPSTRFSLALVCFLGCLVTYTLRTNLSFAIVCMVAEPKSNMTEISTNETLFDRCGNEIMPKEAKPNMGDFDWSKETQGTVLGAFFYGYLGSQVLGGYLATLFGGKRVILATVLGGSLLSLATPIAARTGSMAIIALRGTLGFLQGATFPAMHTMWSVWGPPMELSVLTGVTYAGGQIGNVIVLPLSGFLCESSLGWPSIFYILGGAGVLWCVLWVWMVADRPTTHPRISAEERDYIVTSLEASMGKQSDKPPATPWLKIWTSRAVWACWIGHFAGDWGAYTMLVSLPSFLKDVLGFDLSATGMIAALPYVAYFIVINIGGILSDTIRSKGILGTLNARRASMICALFGQAGFLIAAGYCKCGQEYLVIIFITLAMAVSGLQYSGFVVNYLDIAPPFSGTIMGTGNTLSCLAGILTPEVTAFLTPNGTPEEWRVVLFVTGGILVFGAVVFCLLASGEVQDWAKVKSSDEEEVPLQEKA